MKKKCVSKLQTVRINRIAALTTSACSTFQSAYEPNFCFLWILCAAGYLNKFTMKCSMKASQSRQCEHKMWAKILFGKIIWKKSVYQNCIKICIHRMDWIQKQSGILVALNFHWSKSEASFFEYPPNTNRSNCFTHPSQSKSFASESRIGLGAPNDFKFRESGNQKFGDSRREGNFNGFKYLERGFEKRITNFSMLLKQEPSRRWIS